MRWGAGGLGRDRHRLGKTWDGKSSRAGGLRDVNFGVSEVRSESSGIGHYGVWVPVRMPFGSKAM